jgi:hypothetical protein
LICAPDAHHSQRWSRRRPAGRKETISEAIAAADQRDLAAARRDLAARDRDDAAHLRDLVALGPEEACADHDGRADREATARDRQAAHVDRHWSPVDLDGVEWSGHTSWFNEDRLHGH